MQDLSGDFSSKLASSPKPPAADNRPQPTRGRPASDNIRIPWQVLELTGASVVAAADGGGSSTGGSSMGEVKKPAEDMDPNRSEGSSRRLVSHKRKHSQTVDHHSPGHHPHSLQASQPVSPTKSPVQQEAADDDDSPDSGCDDDAVAVQGKAKMEEPSAAAGVVSEKEKINVEALEAAKEEDPSADEEDGKDMESIEAVEVKNEEDTSDDDAVTSEVREEMMEPLEAAVEGEKHGDDDAVTDEVGENEEIMEALDDEPAAEENIVEEDDEPCDAGNKGEKDKKEASEETATEGKNKKESCAEEKHEEEKPSGTVAGEKRVDESSSDAAEKPIIKFEFDLNELPSDEEEYM